MIQMLLDHPARGSVDFSSLRLILYAGSPISLGLIKRAIAHAGRSSCSSTAPTETSGAVSMLRAGRARPRRRGRAAIAAAGRCR